ncbi:hypothetical protein HNY73_013575 [Argiope bruennichi]|uniref:Uncharacterized protein n=1 Tax=Argiope bruennichi TaxID=94029 RepID=A0A8T0F4I6_ARGBR|nr:hypothetical protein HNY73_013575 [Argiope bruennichi]
MIARKDCSTVANWTKHPIPWSWQNGAFRNSPIETGRWVDMRNFLPPRPSLPPESHENLRYVTAQQQGRTKQY